MRSAARRRSTRSRWPTTRRASSGRSRSPGPRPIDLLGILLCGGQARRFGGDKLLAGSPPIGERAALNLRAAVGRVLAVVPLGAPSLVRLLESAGCEVLETDRCARGMGASLAAAVEASSGCEGWIVALGDMPAIEPGTIRAVADAIAAGAPLAAPFDASGRRGHPVGFAAALRPQLLALDGDTGARAVLERHSGDLRRIVVDDRGVFIDIDSPADLEEFRSGK